MSVTNKNHALLLSNRFHLHISHYARGTYPSAEGVFAATPVNRLLIPLDSSRPDESYIRDKNIFFRMRPGHIYFIPSHHQTGVYLTEEMQFISIQFLLDFHNGIDFFSSLRKIFEFEAPAFARQADEIYGTASDFLMTPPLYALVFGFIGRVFEETSLQGLNLTPPLNSWKELEGISETCTAATTVADLAELCGICRDTFSRTFTRKNGISPKQFLNRCILHRAYLMLSADELKIHEIAEKLDFNNEFYFSRFFKKHTGLSPRFFRSKYLV